MGADIIRIATRAEPVPRDTRFLVSHEVHPLPAGGVRIAYTVRVAGADAAILGPLVTADFAEMVAALRALAEQAPATRA